MELADHVRALHESAPDLAAEVGDFRTLEHILNWLPAHGIDYRTLDLVTQDEYSHDLLVPLPGRWLAFAMT